MHIILLYLQRLQIYYYFLKRTICIALAAALCVLDAASQDLSLRTVVIDAGHGGKDPGAVSRDKKTYEKTLTLDIARKLRDKINEVYPEVKVVMTRDKDVYVDLEERARIANKAKADLFVSIHINAAKSTAANGYSVHLLGQSSDKNKDLFASNLEVCKRENSVIMLEDDYQTKYQGFDPSDPESFIFMQLMQSSHLESSMLFGHQVSTALKGCPIKADRGIWQAPLWVLWRTAMPSALIELGFISNAADLETLRSESNRDKLAQCLLEGFAHYKDSYDGTTSFSSAGETGPAENAGWQQVGTTPAKAAEPVKEAVATSAAEAPAAEAEVLYGVQIFAGSRKLDSRDRQFLGYEPKILPSGSIFKYVIAVSESEDEARKSLVEIRQKYPQCFLVKITGQTASLVKN